MRSLCTAQPDGRSHIAIRTRALDDLVAEEMEAMLPSDLIQVVSLGAGMCTRPWRLPAPDAEVVWFEVDRPDSMRLKTALAAKQGVQPSVGSYRAIGIDFSDPSASLTRGLEENGFDPQAATIFVMEGMLPYLEYSDVEQLAEELNELAEGKVRIVMTMINEGFLQELHHPTQATQQKYPGTNEVGTLFASSWEGGVQTIFEDAGWSLESIISREDYAKKNLGVEMLFYTFPDRRTATEWIILMRRPETGFLGFLHESLGIRKC